MLKSTTLKSTNDIVSVIIEDDDEDNELNLNSTLLNNILSERLSQKINENIDENIDENVNENVNENEEIEIIIDENEINNDENKKNKKKKPRTKKIQQTLNKYFNEDPLLIEIGIDEVGRGPLFGRVYASAVILPKDDSFDHSQMKDSKKFHSKSKIASVSEYIKTNAIAWSVKYEDEDVIDNINILQATQHAMHQCVNDILIQLKRKSKIDNVEFDLSKILLIVDGNYFKSYTTINKTLNKIVNIKHVTIEQGDNKYTSIAAASILAKVERDNYIDEMCEKHPELVERYKIDSNKGYGSKAHLDGIKQWGISPWHRKTFGICKSYT
jgi:ribonuclease HII